MCWEKTSERRIIRCVSDTLLAEVDYGNYKSDSHILILSGQLWTYLADLNEQAQERLSLIIEQMKVSEGVTEELKAADQMAWVGAMNSIRNRAEEIILREMIYEEDDV